MHNSIYNTDSLLQLSDRELFLRFEQYGKMALHYRNKVIGLLPEVAKRKLHLQRGCDSIVEYAKKVAGLSEEQIRRVLNLHAGFRETPLLRSALEDGDIGLNKLARVASIATKENQEALIEKVKILSNRALETYVRDYKFEMAQPSGEAENVHVHTSLPDFGNLSTDSSGAQLFSEPVRKMIEVAGDIVDEFEALRAKGFDIDDMLREMLAKREDELEREKFAVAESLPPENSRYVPVRVRRIIVREYGTRCAKPSCHKPSRQLHHTARYGMTKSHDPHYLAPLCDEHHEIAHAIDVQYVSMRKEWNR